jgi:hypothetical protein
LNTRGIFGILDAKAMKEPLKIPKADGSIGWRGCPQRQMF